MTFQVERDEAAEQIYATSDRDADELSIVESRGFKKGANWALQSSLLKQMAKALERHTISTAGFYDHDVIKALTAYHEACKEMK